jgi:hypothetical protein
MNGNLIGVKCNLMVVCILFSKDKNVPFIFQVHPSVDMVPMI